MKLAVMGLKQSWLGEFYKNVIALGTHAIVKSKTMNFFTLKTSRKIIETLKIKIIDNRFFCLESVVLSTGCFNSALRNKMQIDDLFQYFNKQLAYFGYKSNEMVY